MTYLRDVNALVGLDSSRIPWSVAAWLRAEHFPSLATCSITELGFLRVLAQAPGYGFTFAQARILLLQMKKAKGPEFTFIADDHDVSLLPAWVKTAGVDYGRTSAEASWRKQALLATLDVGIPGAYLIPAR